MAPAWRLRHHALPPGLAQAVSKQEKGEAWGLPGRTPGTGNSPCRDSCLWKANLVPWDQPYLGLEGIKAGGG